MGPQESTHRPMYFDVVKRITKKGNIRYHARIMGGNNETVFVTQSYKAKQSAKHACEIVKAQAGAAEIREVDES